MFKLLYVLAMFVYVASIFLSNKPAAMLAGMALVAILFTEHNAKKKERSGV